MPWGWKGKEKERKGKRKKGKEAEVAEGGLKPNAGLTTASS